MMGSGLEGIAATLDDIASMSRILVRTLCSVIDTTPKSAIVIATVKVGAKPVLVGIGP